MLSKDGLTLYLIYFQQDYDFEIKTLKWKENTWEEQKEKQYVTSYNFVSNEEGFQMTPNGEILTVSL